jgi:hypothetical protein
MFEVGNATGRVGRDERERDGEERDLVVEVTFLVEFRRASVRRGESVGREEVLYELRTRESRCQL